MLFALTSLLAGCAAEAPPAPAPAAAPAPVPAPLAEPGKGEVYTAPALEAAPEGPYGDSIRRGYELFTKTAELLPDNVPGNQNCSTCHLDGGRQLGAAALLGVHDRFPKYMERTGAVIALHDRVNYCFTRSLAGSRLPAESQEMTDLLAYLAFLSVDAPKNGKVPGVDIPKVEGKGDAATGEKLYAEKGCVACHGAEGKGVDGAFPALWGPDSYSIGASMAREERAASFIKQFMPKTTPGSLTLEEAFHLSAFINSHPRPDSPTKELDWPQGGAPYDVPYATQGHEAYNPPPSVLERARPELAVVPPPPSVRGAAK